VNSCWPTYSKILTGLLARVDRLGQKLDTFGLMNFKKGWAPLWLDEMDNLVFQIALAAGKPKAKARFHQQYRQLLARGRKALAALETQFGTLRQNLHIDAFAPQPASHDLASRRTAPCLWSPSWTSSVGPV